jgi:DNA-binding NarL/FixJ family response regulator
MNRSRFSHDARRPYRRVNGDRPYSLRVVLADDHRRYREGLARLLRASGVDVVAEVPNGAAAIRAVLETAPDVALIDLNMPGVSGAEVARRLAERAPRSRVLMLSVSALEDDISDAMRAGASGYVLKDRPVEEVVEAIRAAAGAAAATSPVDDHRAAMPAGRDVGSRVQPVGWALNGRLA